MKTEKILIVEDDEPLLKYLKANLKARGYAVVTARDGLEAIDMVEREMPSLLLLDINLPKKDGLQVCMAVRKWSSVPILIISARGRESDKVASLDMGADDYITKPFGVEELLARVRALFRRSGQGNSEPPLPRFVNGDFEFDFAGGRVAVLGTEIRLTHIEYELLKELVKNAGKIMTHNMLLGRVWGPEYVDAPQYLHVIIYRLRKKIEPKCSAPKYIISIPGVGYRFQQS